MSYSSPVLITENHYLDDLLSSAFNYFIIKIEENIELFAPDLYLSEGLTLSFVRKDINIFTCSIFGHYILPGESMDLIYFNSEWIENKYSLM